MNTSSVFLLVSTPFSVLFMIFSLMCMQSRVVSYSMLDILQFWKPHVADVLSDPFWRNIGDHGAGWYTHVTSPPINEARIACLIVVILLTLCVCSLLGAHISLRFAKRKECQDLDSEIVEHTLKT